MNMEDMEEVLQIDANGIITDSNGADLIFSLVENTDSDQSEIQPTRGRSRGRGRGRGRGGRSSGNNSPVPGNKKKFYVAADIVMLKAVVQNNPYEGGTEAWNLVMQTLKDELDFTVSQRQVYDRCMFLLKKLWDELICDLNKTGTETQWDERANLLDSVSQLYKDSTILTIVDETTGVRSSNLPGMSRAEKSAASTERDDAAQQCLITSHSQSLDCCSIASDRFPERSIFRAKRAHSQVTPDLLVQKAKLNEELQRADQEMQRTRAEREAEWRDRQLAMDERRLEMEEKRLRLKETKEMKKLKQEDDRIEQTKQQQNMFLEIIKMLATNKN